MCRYLSISLAFKSFFLNQCMMEDVKKNVRDSGKQIHPLAPTILNNWKGTPQNVPPPKKKLKNGGKYNGVDFVLGLLRLLDVCVHERHMHLTIFFFSFFFFFLLATVFLGESGFPSLPFFFFFLCFLFFERKVMKLVFFIFALLELLYQKEILRLLKMCVHQGTFLFSTFYSSSLTVFWHPEAEPVICV